MNINRVTASRMYNTLNLKNNARGTFRNLPTKNRYSVRNIGIKIGDLGLNYGAIGNKEYFQNIEKEKADLEQVKKSPPKVDIDFNQDELSTCLSINLSNIRSINISCTFNDISSEEN